MPFLESVVLYYLIYHYSSVANWLPRASADLYFVYGEILWYNLTAESCGKSCVCPSHASAVAYPGRGQFFSLIWSWITIQIIIDIDFEAWRWESNWDKCQSIGYKLLRKLLSTPNPCIKIRSKRGWGVKENFLVIFLSTPTFLVQ